MTSIWPKVWECAGVLRMAPWPFTLFELATMAMAARADAWDHTAFIRADTFNGNRGKGAMAKRPGDFHPWPMESDILRERGTANPFMWKAVKDKWTAPNDS